jgi:uncharacterized protein YbbC (DUF1343 family)
MLPIPVVYGMTAGELAQMTNGEGWLENTLKCKLTVIPCKNYSQSAHYKLPINPSPNLTSMEAVYLYPSLGFFEGTIMDVGRGTPFPFRVIGNPGYPSKDFSYTPVASPSNKNPLHKGLKCYGKDLRGLSTDSLVKIQQINLTWLLEAYSKMHSTSFFTNYFNYLAGSDELKKQIMNGWSEEQIRKSWEEELEKFKKIRAKYLIYKD